LLHISKMGGGKRIERVEDVLELGDEIEVRVDDVDPQGKVSLSPVVALGGGANGSDEPAPRRASPSGDTAAAPVSAVSTVSFEEAFDAELRQEFGDLGPAEAAPSGDRGGRSRPGGDRGGRGRGGRDRRR
jgi:polyribonucleotide nucleotidyltransferase